MARTPRDAVAGSDRGWAHGTCIICGIRDQGEVRELVAGCTHANEHGRVTRNLLRAMAALCARRVRCTRVAKS